MGFWNYFADRAAYDALRSGWRTFRQARRESNAGARETYLTTWNRSIRTLAHKKYELTTIDHYGLVNEEAWISYLRQWFKSEMVPAMRRFSPKVTIDLTANEMPAIERRLEALVEQIRQHEAGRSPQR